MQSGIRWNNTASTCSTVGIVGRTDQRSLLSLLQLADALVPASDDLANADLELERFSTGDRGVEDLAVWELSRIVNLHHGAFGNDWTSAVVLRNDLHLLFLIYK